ncbi:MAG: UDP-GlcNAc:undecaprenyl-phosphate GlcNAc-1-phosphate transferase [Gammaproteobacteria bacterium]|jgi:UDP-GlcNAc:undecaprenyl-phosphate GlcNAc-1-phosphate transferase
MNATLTVLIAFSVSVISIEVFTRLAPVLGLVDRPGGHKHHHHPVPLVGGLALFTATTVAATIYFFFDVGPATNYGTLFGATAIVALTGFADDVWELGPKVRMGLQAVAALVMVLGAGVVLVDLGQLLGPSVFVLAGFSIPFTVFATCGVINSFNMTDGMDGLAGSLSLVSFALLGSTAYASGNLEQATIAAFMMAAIVGFLLFNLRYPGHHRASVYLGDTGSYVIGFVLAWLCIDLSQGPERAFSPVTALWIFGFPLFDTLAVMIRRRWLGSPLLESDRTHFHHLLNDAGFRVSHSVYITTGLHLVIGVVGVQGYYLGAPDFVMFYLGIGCFVSYAYVVSRPWRFVPVVQRLHRSLGLSTADTDRIYVGNLTPERVMQQLAPLGELVGKVAGAALFEHPGSGYQYAVVEVVPMQFRSILRDMRQRLPPEVTVRPFVPRYEDNDRRGGQSDKLYEDQRSGDRRLANDAAVHPQFTFSGPQWQWQSTQLRSG